MFVAETTSSDPETAKALVSDLPQRHRFVISKSRSADSMVSPSLKMTVPRDILRWLKSVPLVEVSSRQTSTSPVSTCRA